MSEPVSVNGTPLPPEDLQVIIKELDNRRRHYHVRARGAKNFGTQQAESRKADRLDDLIKLLTSTADATDPSDERLKERRAAKAKQNQYRRRHRVSR